MVLLSDTEELRQVLERILELSLRIAQRLGDVLDKPGGARSINDDTESRGAEEDPSASSAPVPPSN